ncbi:MAG TPA: helix-turn-helix domain-containing protein [Gemmatimonadaceae bacterium]|nr:helix-turn-helix domain-containing protein [Gemmatimonadaceae bacterium]
MRGDTGFTVEHCVHPEHLPRRLRLAPPSAIVLPLRPGAAPAAEATIREVRALCPEVPVVVYCPPGPDGAAVLAAARAGAEHFAFAPADDLTRVLTRVIAPRASATASRGAAEARLSALPSLARRLLEVAMRADPPPTKVPALARAMGLNTRSLRRMLTRRGWPPPKTLLDAGRALRALLALADGEHPAHAATAAGFASPRAVPRALRRLLAHAPDVRVDRGPRPLRAQLPRLLDLLERMLVERGPVRAEARPH